MSMLVVLTVLMSGCGKAEVQKETISEPVSETAKTATNVDYKSVVQNTIKQELEQIIVEDFDNDGEKEAFALTIISKDESELGMSNEYELWFLTKNSQEKLLDTFAATKDSSIKLLDFENKYVLFNEMQERPNNDMKSIVYGVEKNKTVELFNKSNIDILYTDTLYGHGYSYYIYSQEADDYMGFCEQNYAFYWDKNDRTIKEYEAKEISEKQFMELSGAMEVKDKLENKIKKKYSGEIAECSYLSRENDTVDINMIIADKYGERYKMHTTVAIKDDVLVSEFEICEGNKEASIFKSLEESSGMAKKEVKDFWKEGNTFAVKLKYAQDGEELPLNSEGSAKIHKERDYNNGAIYNVITNSNDGNIKNRSMAYFYVEDEKIYVVDNYDKNADKIDKNNFQLAYQEKNMEKDSGEGLHYSITNGDDTVKFSLYTGLVETNYFQNIEWGKERNIKMYETGYGAGRDLFQVKFVK